MTDTTSKIRVYYDNTIFVLQRIGGISIVFQQIISRMKLSKLCSVQFITNGAARGNLLYSNLASGCVQLKETGINKNILPFSPLVKILKANSIYHTTYNRYSFQSNIKKVITIHDLGYEKGIMRAGIKKHIHLLFKKIAIKNADAIICVSKNTRDDLEYFYAAYLGNKLVKVIYNGVDEDFLAQSEVLTAYEEESIKEIIYVGSRSGYKNFDKLIFALENLNGYTLSICGGAALTQAEKELLERVIPGKYNAKPDLTTQQLLTCYLNAFCLIYPSSYEGFGLPILEAMACGCPVIACSNSSIPEISGGAAELVDEVNAETIKNALIRLNNDKYREKLTKHGRVNAQNYSWERAFLETEKLYIELSNIKYNN